MPSSRTKWLAVAAVAILALLALSGWRPYDRATWDTQSDMFLALLGAVAAIALFSRLHDRQLERVGLQ